MLFKKDVANDYLPVCSLQDDKREISTIVKLNTFENRHLVFGKAKAFGVHTNMYFVEDAPLKMTGGCTYTFTWEKD